MNVPDHPAARNAVLRPRRLGHVNLFVSDLGEARRFYSEVCGFVEIFEEPAITAAFMSNGNTHHDLGLIEASRTDRVDRDGNVLIAAVQRGSVASLNHLGFEMASERQLVAAYEVLKSRGIKVSRTVDHGLAHSVYMPDPDGNMLEFYADVVDDWRGFWKSSVGKTVTGGWRPQLEAADPTPHYQQEFEADIHPTAPIHARRVTCATLGTAQLDDMLAFYTEIVGLKPLPGSDGRQVSLAGETGEVALRLVHVPGASAGTFLDMGIELAGERPLIDAKACLRGNAFPIEEEQAQDGRMSFLTRDRDGFGVRFHARA